MAPRAAENTASDTANRIGPLRDELGRVRGGNPGNKGGTGRTPNVIRRGLREKIPAEVAKLERNVRRMESLVAEVESLLPPPEVRADDPNPVAANIRAEDRLTALNKLMTAQERLMAARQQLLDYRAKYGVGTTQTATDTEGRDATPPGRLSPTEMRAEILRAFAEQNS